MAAKIIVAGGGLGGLSAACCLLKAGHEVVILEQASMLGEVGAGIQVSANPMHVLNDLGLGPQIEELAVRPGAYVFRLHDSGEEVGRFALAAEHLRLNGAPYNQMHRADLHRLLERKMTDLGGQVRLSSRVSGFEETAQGVVVRLDDGDTVVGDLLIGADGIKSVIRSQLLGAAPAVYTGDAVWRITLPTDRLPQGFMDPVMSVWMGPGAHVVCYYLRAGALLNFVGSVETSEVSEESWTAKFPWDHLKADFVGWHPDMQTIIDNADRDKCYRWSLFYRPPIDNWSGRRATLLGDAVHATLPYRAQGAAMAIEDGAVLTRALGDAGSIPDALQLYQRNRIERTARIVKNSGNNRDLFHMRDQDALRQAFKNRDEGGDRNGWLYSYNPLTVPLT